MSDTCPEPVYRGSLLRVTESWEPCGKPVKRDGLCGIHAREADQLRAAKERNRERKRLEDHAAELAKALADLGVEVFPLYGDDRLQMTAAETEKLIARLRAYRVQSIPHSLSVGTLEAIADIIDADVKDTP